MARIGAAGVIQTVKPAIKKIALWLQASISNKCKQIMITLPSDRSEFAGFGKFYENEIAPYLAREEDGRRQAVMQAILVMIVVAVGAVALLIFLPFGDVNRQLALFLGVGGFAFAIWRISRTRNAITHGLLQRVCGKLGYQYRQDISRPEYFETFDRLNLMPGFNREAFEDEVAGARGGVKFVFCEAHLRFKSSGKNSSTHTVFHGQLLVIDYLKKFLGETVIKRDRGIFNRLMKPGKGFQNVGIASPKFEKIFEAWSTDQVEARALLDPLVLERFEELDRLFDGADLRAAFSDGKLYVAVETGDALNMGSMFNPLRGPERVNAILKEFDIIFDLIDVVMKRVDAPLPAAFSVDDVKQIAD